MNKWLTILIRALFFCCLCIRCLAQETGTYSSYSDIQLDDVQIERLINLTNEEIIDLYINSQNERYNINQITKEELRSLRIFSESQIDNFLFYRNTWGPFMSVYELQAIDEFDIQTIRQFLAVLNDFIYTYDTHDSKESHQYFSVGSTRLIQKKQGLVLDSTGTKKFRGDPYKLFFRYSLNYKNKISFGLTAEKDEGEEFSLSPQKGNYVFDQISAFLSVKNLWKVKNLIIGDYRIQAGQGLVFSNMYSFGKGTEVIASVRKSNTSIKPVSSSYEVKDFSGVALNFGLSRFDINLFGSRVQRDATLYSFSEIETSHYFKSFTNTGLHRTENELNKKRAVIEKNFGINIDYQSKKKNLNVGFNSLFTNFSLPVIKDNTPENKYSFDGKSSLATSLYFNYYSHDVHLFSEVATSNDNGIGIISGLIHRVNSSIFLSILYRNLQPDFHSFHGNAFSESSQPNNEEGLYFGLRLSPFPNVKLNFYYDIFSFPWLKSNLVAPSRGYEYMTFMEYEKYRKFYVNFRCQYNSNMQTMNEDNLLLNRLVDNQKLNLITNISIHANQFLKIFQKIQYSQIFGADNLTSNYGMLATFGLNLQKERYGVSTSFSSFDADNYQNRLYFYQRSVPHGYNYPFFQNKGANINLTINYQINPVLIIWANFNQTVYSDKYEIGSGDDLINGNKKSFISVELTGRF